MATTVSTSKTRKTKLRRNYERYYKKKTTNNPSDAIKENIGEKH